MFCELLDHAGVRGSFECQLHGDLQHVLAEERHPGSAVGLLEKTSGGKRGAAIKDANVIQSEKTAFKGVSAGAVLAVHPPDEVEQQLLEDAFQPVNVAAAAQGLSQAISEDGGPGVDRRVNVAKIPFVRR